MNSSIRYKRNVQYKLTLGKKRNNTSLNNSRNDCCCNIRTKRCSPKWCSHIGKDLSECGRVCGRVYMCICGCGYKSMCMYVYTRILTCAHSYALVHICKNVYSPTSYMLLCVYIYIYIFIYIYLYIVY